MSNNYAPCFNRIKLVVIPSHIEFPWFYNIGVFKNFAKFGGKHLCLSLYFNKMTVLRRETLSKRDSDTAVFLCEILTSFL